jgi:hypothetical protein
MSDLRTSEYPPPPRCDPACGPEEHIAGCPNGDDLRTRIAAVLRQELFGNGGDGDVEPEALADAVIMVLIPESSTDGKSDDETD